MKPSHRQDTDKQEIEERRCRTKGARRDIKQKAMALGIPPEEKRGINAMVPLGSGTTSLAGHLEAGRRAVFGW